MGGGLPLMLDLVFYSVVEVLSGLAPTFTTFLILRALFGIGMGGEWGVGASLAMEKVPPRLRGVSQRAAATGLRRGKPAGLALLLRLIRADRLAALVLPGRPARAAGDLRPAARERIGGLGIHAAP